MRLLVLSTWWPTPPDNGSRVRAFQLLRRLGTDHAITLVAFGMPDDPAAAEPLRACCERVIGLPPLRVSGGRLGPRGLLSPVPRFHVQTDSAAMRAHAHRLAPEHDAVLGLQLSAARYLVDIAGVPRIFEEAEVTAIREPWLTAPTVLARARHGLTWWKARNFVRRIAGAMDRVTVVSHLERQALLAMGCDAERIAVVPNGVDITGGPRSDPGTARVIYPGSVQFDANLDAVRHFVHEVWPLVRQARPDATFWVTGATDGVDVTDLRQPGVTFTGRLADVAPAVSDSAVCVVPLRAGGGTRLKVLQAMALGVPVVSTPKGVEGLDIVDGEHVLVRSTAGALAAAILQVLADPARAARLGTAAHARVRERYDWNGIAAALDRVIRDAVQDHPSRARRQARRVAPATLVR